MLCFLKYPKIFQFFFWAYLLQTLTRPRSSTWVTKGFKGLVACIKCNNDSYDGELGFWSFVVVSLKDK